MKKGRGLSHRIGLKNLKVILLNLYQKWLVHPETYNAIHMGESHYSYKKNSRYNVVGVSKGLPQTVNKLIIQPVIKQVLSPTQSQERAQSLNRFQFFTTHIWSDHKEIDRLVRELYAELVSGATIRGKYIELGAKGKTDYKKIDGSDDGVYEPKLTRIRATQTLVSLFEEQGWRKEMVLLVPRECIVKRSKPDKNGNKHPILYSDSKETRRMRRELTSYNNLLKQTYIDIPLFPEEGIARTYERNDKEGQPIEISTTVHLTRADTYVRRIFNNNSWKEGGRYYGGFWQNLPNNKKEGYWRRNIYIGTMPTIEIDYSGIHIVILYAMEGIDYWKEDGRDPYDLKEYRTSDEERSTVIRALLKLLLLVTINLTNKDPKRHRNKRISAAVWKAIKRDKDNEEESKYGFLTQGSKRAKEEGIVLKEVIEAFESRHPKIAKHLASGIGTRLQKVDSEMAEYVINRMTEGGHPVLSVHDSFLCEEPFYPTLEKYVREGFASVINKHIHELVNVLPRIEFKSPLPVLDKKPDEGEKLKSHTGKYVSLWQRDPVKWDRLHLDETYNPPEFRRSVKKWLGETYPETKALTLQEGETVEKRQFYSNRKRKFEVN